MTLIFPIIALICAPALYCVLGRPRLLRTHQKGNLNNTINNRVHSISIIIPARDEETNIAILLNSIQDQNMAPDEIIVVDDGSSDATAEVAKKRGARVLTGATLPDGWKGKPWACQQGAEAALGDLFLFLDADTSLHPDALTQIHRAYQNYPAVLSVAPYHTIKKPYEELSAFFNLLMIAGANAFGTGTSSGENPALFGQCMLISRQHYQEVGGHASVRAEVLENFHLAKQLESHQIPRLSLLGRSLVSMRMFPGGMEELCSSWRKGFTSGAANTEPRALIFSSIWISGAMFTLVALLLCFTPYTTTPLQLITACVYLIYTTQCYFAFRLVGSFSALNALLFPISLIFYQYLFFSALIDQKRGKTTLWKGRPTN